MTSADTHRDVVELLLEAHTEARQVVSLAESLAHQSCTTGCRFTALTKTGRSPRASPVATPSSTRR